MWEISESSIWKLILAFTLKSNLDNQEKLDKIINNNSIPLNEKVEEIINSKSTILSNLKSVDILRFLSDTFYVDWSIKLTASDLWNNFDVIFEDLKDFTYKKWSEIVFRWNKYYFLFDSLKVSWISEFWSIDSLEINDIDMNEFISCIISHYRNLNELISVYWLINNIDEWLQRKILLWLIDAKINIISFFQNIWEIFMNENFINPNFSESLVFWKWKVKEIENTYKKLPRINPDKKLYNIALNSLGKYRDTNSSNYLSSALKTNWSNYTQLLLWEIKVFSDLISWDYENVDDIDAFMDTWTCLLDCFNMVNKYVDISKDKRKESHIKKYKNLENYDLKKKDWRFDLVKKDFLNKLVRLYREENDPLVMIQTSINAYIWLINKWFNPDKDFLNIISVNYWWATIGSYVKPVIDILINNSINSTEWSNIAYSNYDLKNQSDNLSLIDYPTSLEFKKTKNFYSSSILAILSNNFNKLEKINNIWITTWWKDWAIVFDDNTYSWQTLNKLKWLLEDEKQYDQVEIIACRTNTKIERFSEYISESDRLELMKESWVNARVSKLKLVNWNQYNELISRIVWRRIYKEKNNNFS